MPHRSEGARDVSREAADICAFGDVGDEGGFADALMLACVCRAAPLNLQLRCLAEIGGLPHGQPIFAAFWQDVDCVKAAHHDVASSQHDMLTGSGQIIGTRAPHLQGRVGGRHLFDRPGEA